MRSRNCHAWLCLVSVWFGFCLVGFCCSTKQISFIRLSLFVRVNKAPKIIGILLERTGPPLIWGIGRKIGYYLLGSDVTWKTWMIGILIFRFFIDQTVVLLSLLHIATLVDATSKLESFWSMDTNAEASALHSWVVSSAAIFVLVALILSMYLIIDHLIAYNQPEEQKFLIGLILMVPVYSVESFLSLLNTEAAFNCEILRDCYEAFALYCFERYLIACLGGEECTIKFMDDQSLVNSFPPLVDDAYAYGFVRHPFPLNCILRDWELGSDFYQAVKIGIVQYMILKMICALLAMIFESLGVYGEGKFEWGYAYPYLAVILSFCQTWALYCLVQFYSVTKNKLAPIHPLAKFLTFKSIIFLTWWQGVAVAFLFSSGAFKGSLAQVLETRIQDYVICIEMGVAAVIHIHVFPAEPYKHGERCERNVAVMADYASLEAPPDPEEVEDCERSPALHVSWVEEEETHPKIHQSVCDVVLGSGGIVVDDVKFTVSHVVEPVERGLSKLNKTFHEISENLKKKEMNQKFMDDSCLVPLKSNAHNDEGGAGTA